jgi:hypothetical protein
MKGRYTQKRTCRDRASNRNLRSTEPRGTTCWQLRPPESYPLTSRHSRRHDDTHSAFFWLRLAWQTAQPRKAVAAVTPLKPQSARRAQTHHLRLRRHRHLQPGSNHPIFWPRRPWARSMHQCSSCLPQGLLADWVNICPSPQLARRRIFCSQAGPARLSTATRQGSAHLSGTKCWRRLKLWVSGPMDSSAYDNLLTRNCAPPQFH